MMLPINIPNNLIRFAKFFSKTTDRILNPNFEPGTKVPVELLDIK